MENQAKIDELGPFGDISAEAAQAIEGMFELTRAEAHSVATVVCELVRARLTA